MAELDSALNKWIDAVPDHLRWDPHKEANTPFFTQSCVLYASYYQLQILIHRPFIPLPRRPSVLSFPSLAICTNAARSCSHVLDVYNRRCGVATPSIQVNPSLVGYFISFLSELDRCLHSPLVSSCYSIFGEASDLALRQIL